MCNHETTKVGEIKVCRKCGFAMIDGKPFFDRQFVNYKPKRKGGKKR